ncbi:hypothetical protein GYA93_18235 [Gordonia desulfuricans]|uniref:Uncharacterized protein n=1 Tax=Gordonia desulfuricans TaxID=89051 RepID=A0A7K3LU01_9ACTN|nr:hypothetical protein [Gordonia desulfuricans]NDK91501.1 hypothetical protein [Gordonia desulfuricans]
MIAAIIVAEIAFWVLLLAGLALRYVARARRLSTLVLAAVPVVDLALLVLVAVDVTRGAPPTRPHAFAALYLGITVAFGHHIIQRTDAWFRYRFAGGPKPLKAPKGSTAEVHAIWREWFRVVLAAALGASCLLIMIALEGWHTPASVDDAATHPYWATLLLLPIITAVWFLAGPAFAGRGDPTRDRQSAKSTGRAAMTLHDSRTEDE